MDNRDKRLESFQHWPAAAPVRPRELVDAGFYYGDKDDEVTCFSCSYTLSQWEQGDIPLYEHLRHNPNCTFVLGHKDIDKYTEPSWEETFDAVMMKPPDDHVGTTTADSVQIKPPDYPPIGAARDSVQVKPPDQTTYEMLRDNTANLQIERDKLYQDYRKKETRLDTFKTWRQQSPDPMKLVEAGFFYTGSGDTVCCYQCGGKFGNWEKGDDPLKLHRQKSEECQFFKKQEEEQRCNDAGLVTTDMGPRLNVRRDVKDGTSEGKKKPSVAVVVKEDQPEDPRATAKRCTKCKIEPRDTMFLPCEHFVCCEKCAKDWLKCCKCGFPVTDYMKFP